MKDMRKLTVILGAGASAGINSGRTTLTSPQFKSPLTKELFNQSPSFATVLNKYPQAQQLSNVILRQLNKNPNLSLEQVFKFYSDRLLGGENSIITKQFLQIPLYLNDLLGEVSQHYTTNPYEYSVLVNNCLEKTDAVLFLSLNYDTLLEKALATPGNNFSNESDYISNPKWALAKIHGSVNWYKEIDTGDFPHGENHNAYLNFIHSLSVPIKLKESLIMYPIPGHQKKSKERSALFPAITIPVDGKYEYNCPISMISFCKNFLESCTNFLIIGTSGKDQDLMDLLSISEPKHSLLLSSNQDRAVETINRFESKLPRFKNKINPCVKSGGFTEFINSNEFDQFLEQLT